MSRGSGSRGRSAPGTACWWQATAPIWPDGSVDPDPGAQARRCLAIIGTALAQVGGSQADVVRTRMFLVDARDWEAVGLAHGEVFADVRPAATMVIVAGLLDPRWKVEIEAEAVITAAPPAGDQPRTAIASTSMTSPG